LADCEYKPRQLSLAQTVGLRVPATIVTNAPDEVRRFAAEQGDIIVKSLAEPIIAEAGSQKAIWTRRVTAPELADLAGPCRIWDTIETAIALWGHLYHPDVSRLGISALDDINRQYVWLDDLDGLYSWPMPL
jgi:hypothetical protein